MLNRRCVICLLNKTVSKSKTGFQRRNTDSGREVMSHPAWGAWIEILSAGVPGVNRNEFYKAAAVGMTPSVVFIVSEADYQEERLIRFDGKLYRVIRSYPLSNRKIELVCQGEAPNDD